MSDSLKACNNFSSRAKRGLMFEMLTEFSAKLNEGRDAENKKAPSPYLPEKVPGEVKGQLIQFFAEIIKREGVTHFLDFAFYLGVYLFVAHIFQNAVNQPGDSFHLFFFETAGS